MLGECRGQTDEVGVEGQLRQQRGQLAPMHPPSLQLVGHRRLTTNLGANASNELGEGYGLDDHIVSALVEACHPIGLPQ